VCSVRVSPCLTFCHTCSSPLATPVGHSALHFSRLHLHFFSHFLSFLGPYSGPHLNLIQRGTVLDNSCRRRRTCFYSHIGSAVPSFPRSCLFFCAFTLFGLSSRRAFFSEPCSFRCECNFLQPFEARSYRFRRAFLFRALLVCDSLRGLPTSVPPQLPFQASLM